VREATGQANWAGARWMSFYSHPCRRCCTRHSSAEHAPARLRLSGYGAGAEVGPRRCRNRASGVAVPRGHQRHGTAARRRARSARRGGHPHCRGVFAARRLPVCGSAGAAGVTAVRSEKSKHIFPNGCVVPLRPQPLLSGGAATSWRAATDWPRRASEDGAGRQPARVNHRDRVTAHPASGNAASRTMPAISSFPAATGAWTSRACSAREACRRRRRRPAPASALAVCCGSADRKAPRRNHLLSPAWGSKYK
jgi:hypothetical protein